MSQTTKCPDCNHMADRDYERFKDTKIKWFTCKNCGASFALPILTLYPDAGIIEIQE